jgi:hypothetical protein
MCVVNLSAPVGVAAEREAPSAAGQASAEDARTSTPPGTAAQSEEEARRDHVLRELQRRKARALR